MTSKTARRKRKARITLPGGDAVPQRMETGRPHKEPDNAHREALEARCRVFRVNPTKEGLEAVKSPLMGCSVGRLILREPEPKRAELWNAVYHARRTQLAYDRAIGAPSRHAQVARILAPADAMHADASSPAIDMRSPEDRVRHAASAQMQMEGWIAHTDSRAVSAFKQSVINDPDGPVRDWQGVLDCLRCIVEGLAGQQVKVRARTGRSPLTKTP
jgi:hypothetical protein